MNGNMLGDLSMILIELGAIIVGLAVLARVANRFGVSPIPFYLLAGIGMGMGGVVSLSLSEGFIHIGAEIGVILLLFTLGLEYSGDRLVKDMHHALPAGIADLVINFPPGVAVGLLMGWDLLASVLLGGIVYISSSGIIAKLLCDLKRYDNAETPVILSILVLEDIAMAVFLPLVTIFLIGHGLVSGLGSIAVAVIAGGAMLFVALHYGKPLSRLINHTSNEIVLLTTLGLALLVAGLADRLQFSAAVGAFLVGITLSGPVAEKTHALIDPLRDLFAAIFFLFFGLLIDPATLWPMLTPAVILVAITAVTKIITGWWTTRHMGLNAASRLRAGITLIARGEFSLVIAAMGVGAGLEPRLGALAAAYVLLSAIFGPLLMRVSDPLLTRLPSLATPAARRRAARRWLVHCQHAVVRRL